MGNGQAAWTAMKEEHDVCTKATLRAYHEQLVNSRMERGEDPDHYFFRQDKLRIRLDDTGDSVTDQRF